MSIGCVSASPALGPHYPGQIKHAVPDDDAGRRISPSCIYKFTAVSLLQDHHEIIRCCFATTMCNAPLPITFNGVSKSWRDFGLDGRWRGSRLVRLYALFGCMKQLRATHPEHLQIHILFRLLHFGTMLWVRSPFRLINLSRECVACHMAFGTDILVALTSAGVGALPPPDMRLAWLANQLSPGSIGFLPIHLIPPLFNGCGFGPPLPLRQLQPGHG